MQTIVTVITPTDGTTAVAALVRTALVLVAAVPHIVVLVVASTVVRHHPEMSLNFRTLKNAQSEGGLLYCKLE